MNKKDMRNQAKDGTTKLPEEVLHQYRKERYTDLTSQINHLNELAFKTSERYDHWVLTLSGGALALSLTFLEKIAPKPSWWTLWILALSWVFFIGAILAGFFAIHYSREALYRERDIAYENYDTFISTSSVQNMQGNQPPKKNNLMLGRLEKANSASKICLTLGTGFLCLFAFINLLMVKKPQTTKDGSNEAAVKFYLSASEIAFLTSTNTGVTMSKETNTPREIQGVRPPATDGSIKGIHVGDPTSGIKGSYKPTRQQDSPPPPPPPPPAEK